MPHALASNGRACHLYAALITYNTFIADVLILTTVTLPVPRRTEDGLAEKPVFLGAQAAVVNGFWF
jgi:hypothetical protein